ncbi:unnamed protein product [Adineta steineri]|nr:unnamed protein product [Adineta steineri]
MMTRTKSRAIELELEASQRQLLPEIVIAPPDQVENKETANSLQIATQAHVPRSQNKTTEPIMQGSQQIDSNDVLAATTPADKKTDKTTYDSALTKHYVSTGHCFTSNDFTILLSDRNERRLLVKESFSIIDKNPKLNGTDRSVPLYVFPDGIPKSHNVRLNQPAQTTDIHLAADPPPTTDQPRTTTTT